MASILLFDLKHSEKISRMICMTPYVHKWILEKRSDLICLLLKSGRGKLCPLLLKVGEKTKPSPPIPRNLSVV
jgi:hypothetical protein